jgi:phosphoglycolate phosphatase-like HAD superfamily hydrolase
MTSDPSIISRLSRESQQFWNRVPLERDEVGESGMTTLITQRGDIVNIGAFAPNEGQRFLAVDVMARGSGDLRLKLVYDQYTPHADATRPEEFHREIYFRPEEARETFQPLTQHYFDTYRVADGSMVFQRHDTVTPEVKSYLEDLQAMGFNVALSS